MNYFNLSFFTAVLSSMTLAVSTFRAAYQVFLEVPIIWFGVFVGIGRGLASLLLYHSAYLKKRFNLISFFRLQMVLQVLMVVLLGFTKNSYIVVSIFILSTVIYWGLSKVDESYHMQIIGKSKFKATLLSVSAQIESVISAFFGLSLGFLIEKYSYDNAFLVFGLSVFVIVYLIFVRMNRVYKDVV